jgi:hypothetical protein
VRHAQWVPRIRAAEPPASPPPPTRDTLARCAPVVRPLCACCAPLAGTRPHMV